VKLSALCAGRPLPPGRFLVPISVRARVNPRDIVRLEGVGDLKESNDLIAILSYIKKKLKYYCIFFKDQLPHTISGRYIKRSHCHTGSFVCHIGSNYSLLEFKMYEFGVVSKCMMSTLRFIKIRSATLELKHADRHIRPAACVYI
jgi:hypothetical protein